MREVAFLLRDWDADKHPRAPAGSPEGGQFTSGDSGGAALLAPAATPKPEYVGDSLHPIPPQLFGSRPDVVEKYARIALDRMGMKELKLEVQDSSGYEIKSLGAGFSAAAEYADDIGTIRLFAHNGAFNTVAGVEQLIRHEAQHARYAFMEKMKGQTLHQFLRDNEEGLIKEDGTTEYSQAWWARAKADGYSTAYTRHAVNESLSEMHAHPLGLGSSDKWMPPTYAKLDKMLWDVWRRFHDKGVVYLDTKYSEDQPRDEHGRWSSEGSGGVNPFGGSEGGSHQVRGTHIYDMPMKERIARISAIADDEMEKIGMKGRVPLDVREATLEDMVESFGNVPIAVYDTRDKSIVFFSDLRDSFARKNASSEKQIRGIIRHEAMHARYDYAKDSEAVAWFVKANMEDLIKEDGVTAYSRSWWNKIPMVGMSSRARAINTAINETLAEMHKSGKWSPTYKELNARVDKVWNPPPMPQYPPPPTHNLGVVYLDTKYSDDQPRDDRGRWSDGSSAEPRQDTVHPERLITDSDMLPSLGLTEEEYAVRAGAFARVADDELNRIGMPDQELVVEKMSGGFGRFTTAGEFKPDTGAIHVYAGTLWPRTEGELREVVRHEALHARFEEAITHPEVQQYVIKNAKLLQSEGHVTTYANSFWARYNLASKAGPPTQNEQVFEARNLAVNETLAECHAEGKFPPSYVRLNRLVEKAWQKRRKGVVYLDTKYSEDQPRDDSGRWTSGGGGAQRDRGEPGAVGLTEKLPPVGSPERLQVMRAAVKEELAKLNMPDLKVNVVDGIDRDYPETYAAYSGITGEVTILARGDSWNNKGVDFVHEVIAHEASHARFEYASRATSIMQGDKSKRIDNFIRDHVDSFEGEGRTISDYARSWWNRAANAQGLESIKNATNESLAEAHATGRLAKLPTYKALDGIVSGIWNQRKKGVVYVSMKGADWDPSKHPRNPAGSSEYNPDITKYRDDQLRDDHGRWTDEGGGSALAGQTAEYAGRGALEIRQEASRAKAGSRSVVEVAQILEGDEPPIQLTEPAVASAMSEEDRAQVRANVARVTDQMEQEVRYQLEQTSSGKDWYHEDTQEAFDITAESLPSLKIDPEHPEEGQQQRVLFTTIGGIMSYSMDPERSWDMAARAYEHFINTGEIPARNPETGELWAGGPVSAIKESQLTALNNMVQTLGVKGAADFLTEDHSKVAIAAAREAYGGKKSEFALSEAGDRVAGFTMFGPKASEFILSTNGTDAVAVDRWATRTINRYSHDLTGRDPKSGKTIIKDKPTDLQREVFKGMVTTVSKRVGLRPQQVQAVQWFFEQQLYAHMGSRSKEKFFSDGARMYAARKGKVYSAIRAKAASGPKPEPTDGDIYDAVTQLAYIIRLRCGFEDATIRKGAEWDPEKHPRAPAGSSEGGQFTSDGGGDEQAYVGSTARVPRSKGPDQVALSAIHSGDLIADAGAKVAVESGRLPTQDNPNYIPIIKAVAEDELARIGMEGFPLNIKGRDEGRSPLSFHEALAAYSRKDGDIRIYAGHPRFLETTRELRGVVRHEALHARWDYAKDSGAIIDFIDGNMEQLKSENGVTKYSHAWWERANPGIRAMNISDETYERAKRMAINESLAEMHHINRFKPTYKRLDALVANVWSKRGKGVVVYLPKYSEDQPRDERGRWAESDSGMVSGAEMVSPNVKENLDFDQALEEMKGSRQREILAKAQEVDALLGLSIEQQPALGAWSDGAENSIVGTVSGRATYEQIELSAAMKGMLADQKAVIPFHVEPNGKDAMYRFDAPSSDLRAVHDQLMKDGIEYHTLQPVDHSIRVWVFDKGTEIPDKVRAAGERYGKQVEVWQGRGEFVGGDTRDAGRAVYQSIIERSLEPDRRGQWQRLYGSWRETHPVLHSIEALEQKYSDDQPRDPHGRWTNGPDSPGFNEDGTITLLHGTTALNADSILRDGFRPSNPAAVAAAVEHEYGLPKDSVLNHPWFEFAKNRQDLDKVHLTSNHDVALQYTVPEQLQDALNAAYSVIHPHSEDADFRDIKPKMDAWVKQESARLTKPVVLAVTMPWSAVGDHAFGRKLGLDEYKRIANGELPDNVSIPISALRSASIRIAAGKKKKGVAYIDKLAAAKAPLYVERLVENSGAIGVWAKANGIELAPVPLHVTIVYSNDPMDWSAVNRDTTTLSLPDDPTRTLKVLGDGDGVLVLMIKSPELQARHEVFAQAGASWDYPDYLPHITLCAAKGVQWKKVKPYSGPIELGPEVYAEIDPDAGVQEKGAEWDPAKHPRDERGRWSETGGAGSEAAPAAAATSIPGVPKDVSLPADLQEAVNRGAFTLTAKEVTGEFIHPGERFDITIMPKGVPDSWGTDKSGTRFDPQYMHVDESGRAIPNNPDVFNEPSGTEKGYIFRGMSYEEYRDSMQRGYFETKGGYNLGTEQEGLTYFSTDKGQASYYASGFAPWQYIATPERPAIMVQVRDPGNHVGVAGTGETEVGLRGRISTKEMVAYYSGDPIRVKAGHVDLNIDRWGGRVNASTGSRLSPSVLLRWNRHDVPTKAVYLDTKYSEDQPRDYHGRFSGSGGDVNDEGALAADQVAANRENESRDYQKEKELINALPQVVKDKFAELADLQRGKPEDAMLKVQYAMGGGVLNPVVEHVGDLTNRMTGDIKYGESGYGYVKEKLDKTIHALDHPYGFEREFNDNIVNNAEYHKVPVEELLAKLDAKLKVYADAHRALPVYNEVQRLARDAAVAVGEKRFRLASSLLHQLDAKAQTRWQFAQEAAKYDPKQFGLKGVVIDEKGDWDPEKHPREPGGSSEGGRFTHSGGSGATPNTTSPVPPPESFSLADSPYVTHEQEAQLRKFGYATEYGDYMRFQEQNPGPMRTPEEHSANVNNVLAETQRLVDENGLRMPKGQITILPYGPHGEGVENVGADTCLNVGDKLAAIRLLGGTSWDRALTANTGQVNVVVPAAGVPFAEEFGIGERVTSPCWTVAQKGDTSPDIPTLCRNVFRHELGHALAAMRDVPAWCKTNFFAPSGRPKLGIEKTLEPKWFAKNISAYAASSVPESIAEVFATVTAHDYVRGTLPSHFEKMVDYMLTGKATTRHRRDYSVGVACNAMHVMLKETLELVSELWIYKPPPDFTIPAVLWSVEKLDELSKPVDRVEKGADWDPDKHPRDDRGRWSHSEGADTDSVTTEPKPARLPRHWEPLSPGTFYQGAFGGSMVNGYELTPEQRDSFRTQLDGLKLMLANNRELTKDQKENAGTAVAITKIAIVKGDVGRRDALVATEGNSVRGGAIGVQDEFDPETYHVDWLGSLQRGVGSTLLRGLEAKARGLGCRRVTLTPTQYAIPFYKRHGFKLSGSTAVKILGKAVSPAVMLEEYQEPIGVLALDAEVAQEAMADMMKNGVVYLDKAGDWDPDKHPRVPSGEGGGQFTSTGGAGAAAAEEKPTPSSGAAGAAAATEEPITGSYGAFNRDEWMAMPINERRSEWAKLSNEERDAMADPVHAVPERMQEILGKGKWEESGDTKADIAARVDSYRDDILSNDSADRITAYAQEANDVLTKAGADPEAARELSKQITDVLIAQDYESTGRSLGDHGIHHIEEDARIANEVLALRGQGHDAREEALIYITAAFHDAGYLTDPSRAFLDTPHTRWGTQAYEKNVAPLVTKAFDKDFSNEVASTIFAHDDTTLDWDEAPVRSAFSLADNLALFHAEKMPPLMRLVPANTQVLVGLGRGTYSVEEAQRLIRDNISDSKLPSAMKLQLYSAAGEISQVSPKLALGMVGTKLDKIEWKGDHPSITIRRFASNEALSKVLDVGQKQFSKLAEAYDYDPKTFVSSGKMTLKSEKGKTLLEASIVSRLKKMLGVVFLGDQDG